MTSSLARFSGYLAPVLLAILAFGFHYPRLADRPMHTDEAVHAVKLGILLETGEYIYNPHEYHGPVIYYATLPFTWMAGATNLAEIADESLLRLPIVAMGALLVLSVGLCRRSLGYSEAFFAAIVIGVSPAFSFYTRYYIQEVPFTLFCFLSLAGLWKMLETGRWGWGVAAGVALGLAVALKETWIMVMGCAGLTAVLLHLTSNSRPWPRPFPWRHYTAHFALSGIVTLITALAILSNFLRNPAAVGDTFGAIAGYINRGVSGDSSTFGAGIHDHPWYYYLQLLTWPTVEGPWIWTEGGTLLLGLIGVTSIIRRWREAPGPWHFIAIFTIIITAFYSAIPYKTPWNALPFFLGWCLLAGRGFASIVHGPKSPILAVGFAVILMVWPAALGVQTWRATISRPADPRNPYAYSPTSSDVLGLADRARQIADVSPAGKDMLIQIIAPENDYWPLPWYLRGFNRIGYYEDFSEISADAAMIISTVEPENNDLPILESRQAEYKGLRPDVILTTWIKQDLWDAFIAQQMGEPKSFR